MTYFVQITDIKISQCEVPAKCLLILIIQMIKCLPFLLFLSSVKEIDTLSSSYYRVMKTRFVDWFRRTINSCRNTSNLHAARVLHCVLVCYQIQTPNMFSIF